MRVFLTFPWALMVVSAAVAAALLAHQFRAVHPRQYYRRTFGELEPSLVAGAFNNALRLVSDGLASGWTHRKAEFHLALAAELRLILHEREGRIVRRHQHASWTRKLRRAAAIDASMSRSDRAERLSAFRLPNAPELTAEMKGRLRRMAERAAWATQAP